MRKGQANAGFTLIELLIVIAIIGILAAVLIPNLLAARNKANVTATQSFVRNVMTSVESQRNPNTQELPASASCISILGVSTLPAAVTSCSYTKDATADKFTIAAVAKDADATPVNFDGEKIVVGP